MKKTFKQRLLIVNDGYVALRRSEYPSIADQLDALYKARNGDTSELEAMDKKVTAIKEKYPKPK